MKTATVSKLKASLSEYLRQVKAGEEVLVTERGQPVARLAPPVSAQTFPKELVEMEKQGLIRLGTEKLPRPKDPKGLGGKCHNVRNAYVP